MSCNPKQLQKQLMYWLESMISRCPKPSPGDSLIFIPTSSCILFCVGWVGGPSLKILIMMAHAFNSNLYNALAVPHCAGSRYCPQSINPSNLGKLDLLEKNPFQKNPLLGSWQWAITKSQQKIIKIFALKGHYWTMDVCMVFPNRTRWRLQSFQPRGHICQSLAI